jgi:uncharacterized membrane protein YvbJ
MIVTCPKCRIEIANHTLACPQCGYRWTTHHALQKRSFTELSTSDRRVPGEPARRSGFHAYTVLLFVIAIFVFFLCIALIAIGVG